MADRKDTSVPTITEIRDHVLEVLERRGLEMPPPDPEVRVRMLGAWTSLFGDGLWLSCSEYRDGRKTLYVGRQGDGRLGHMLLGVEWVGDEPPAIIEDGELVLGAWIGEVMALSLTPGDDFGGVLGLPVPPKALLVADGIRRQRRPRGGWKAKVLP
jgi:hypothetical protein